MAKDVSGEGEGMEAKPSTKQISKPSQHKVKVKMSKASLRGHLMPQLQKMPDKNLKVLPIALSASFGTQTTPPIVDSSETQVTHPNLKQDASGNG